MDRTLTLTLVLPLALACCMDVPAAEVPRPALAVDLARARARAALEPDTVAAALARARAAVNVSPTPPAPTPAPDLYAMTYGEAARKAAREGRPLCVWVQYKCPSSAAQLPECVHCFVDEMYGSRTQRVVGAVPDGEGWMGYAGEVSAADCCASSLRAVLERGRQAVERFHGGHHAASSWSARSVDPTHQPNVVPGSWVAPARPAFAPVMAPVMRGMAPRWGGFGGGGHGACGPGG
jgi:hypothetical protein